MGISSLIDAEWFFSEQVLSGFDNVYIKPLMEVMRNGAVDCVNLARAQEVGIVFWI